MLKGGAFNIAAVVAIFLSDVPEGLSSVAGMKKAGLGANYIFGVWGGIAIALGVAALVGCTLLKGFSPEAIAATTAVASGAKLSILVDTMVPEVFEETHDFAGLITVTGFLAALVLIKLGG